jgi:hypothetical protein
LQGSSGFATIDSVAVESIVVQNRDCVLHLEPGSRITFGRGSDTAPVDVPFIDAEISRMAGAVTAVEDHWLISNLSRWSTYVVENPEGGGEFVKVAPRRLDMPVPFEFARVLLPASAGVCSFYVFAPLHQFADENLGLDDDAVTRAAFSLDETAKYFLVLVALCEPRLRDGSASHIPTVPQILQRLGGHGAAAGLTRAAVNFHIDYLARTKLRVKSPQAGGGKADWQRAALISVALRFDLVREEHLALLPPVSLHIPGGMA